MYWLAKQLINLFKSKRKPHPIWDEQLGSYKFWELYDILSKTKNFIPSRIVDSRAIDNEVYMALLDKKLLLLFFKYSPYLNIGITSIYPSDDNRFGFVYLAPALILYVSEARKCSKSSNIKREKTTYERAEVGRKFYASLVKVLNSQAGSLEKLKANTGTITNGIW